MTAVATSIGIVTPPVFRMDIFLAWTRGRTGTPSLHQIDSLEREAFEDRKNGLHDASSATVIESQYRLFGALESILRRPSYFAAQQVYFPLDLQLKLHLVQAYQTNEQILTAA